MNSPWRKDVPAGRNAGALLFGRDSTETRGASQNSRRNVCRGPKLACVGADGHAHRREPVVAVGLRSAGEREELFLDAFSDGPAGTVADGDAVNRAQGRDLDGQI